MGQRTQICIRIRKSDSDIETFAIHNQRGFGRPLVSSTINIVNGAIKLIEKGYPEYYINKERVYVLASMFNNEYVRNSRPYDCSYPFDINEHDNNDGWSNIDIDLKEKTINFSIHDREGKKMHPIEYIEKLECEKYCDDDRKIWYLKMKKNLNFYFNKNVL